MTLQPNAKTLPRYQAIGMIGIVVFLIVIISGYFLIKVQDDNDKRLAVLGTEIYKQQKNQLSKEINAARDYIQYMTAQAETVLMEESQSQVEQAHATATAIYQQQKGKLPDEEIKVLIREALRDVRFFKGRGYLFIDDLVGNCILLPTAPQLEGTSLWNNQDDTGHYIMRGLIDAVDNADGAGFSRYRWYPPGNNVEMAGKIAFVKKFKPFGWVIGAGDYIYRIENDLQDAAIKRLRSIRFGKNGYVAVLHRDGKVLTSASQATPIKISKIPNKQERALVQQLLTFAAQGGGYMTYDWYYPDGQGPASKLSLVEPINELGWVLVAGIYPEEIEQLIADQRQKMSTSARDDLYILLMVLAATGILTIFMALVFTGWFKRLFQRYQDNIDQQREKLERNAEQLQIAARVFETANEGILVTDTNNQIVAANQALTDITGYQEKELVGKDPAVLSSGRHDTLFYRQMWLELEKTGRWQGELWNRRKNGEIYPEWLTISASQNNAGEVVNYVATVSDISERKNTEQRLRYLAEYDPLTELPNRRLLSERASQTLHACERDKKRQFALMFVDLDRFKNINDTLGHAVGDLVLQTIAKRLSKIVRESDTVSRIGGDEFVILINDHNAEAAAARLAAQALKDVIKPIHTQHQELVITPSIGIAIYPDDGLDYDRLMQNADAALYHAKSEGRNNFQFYTEDMNTRVSEKLNLEHDLRKAIKEQQFELFYQPIYQLETDMICSCEALLRWQHPQRGLIAPDQFIPLAEETGLITTIGDWVINEACQQAINWQQQGYQPIPVNVNVSSNQFSSDIVATVRKALKATGLDAKWLTIEITESTLMGNIDTATSALQQLKELGVNIALDDFGTGYSSLAYLKRFPLDKLKIDQAFISGLPKDKDDIAITSSIIDIARNLQLTTIAEGVESQSQFDYLATLGCQQIQGYLKAKPMPHHLMEQQLLTSDKRR